MPVVIVSSDLLSDVPVGRRNNPANRGGANLCVNRWNTGAAIQQLDIGSTLRICTLPANGRYLAGLSKVGFTAGGAGALLNMGYEASRGPYGESVPANPTFFGTALSIAAAGRQFLDTLTASVDEYEAPLDLVLTFTVAGANLPVGFSLGGTIVFAAAYIGLP